MLRDEGEAVGKFDVVVVGSGYGAGVMAARLAEAGLSVCVLERGREYREGEFPDQLGEIDNATQLSTGGHRVGSPRALIDVRLDDELSVVIGCGLGGTSLINANVTIKPSRRVFEQAMWPAAIRTDPGVLEPYFERARSVLRPQQVPSPRPKLGVLEAAARKAGMPFRRADLNVNFDNTEQPACVECGNCVTGCNYGAKNTLCHTYLPIAKRAGAKLFVECLVQRVEKTGDDWIVHYDRFVRGDVTEPREVRARVVVLGAGSLGSTEILLRSKRGGLALSERLGKQFSGNGDSLAFGYNFETELDSVGFAGDKRIDHPVGPTITGIVDLRSDDPSTPLEDSIIIEDGAFPGALARILRRALEVITIRNDDEPPVSRVTWFHKRWRELLDFLGVDHRHGALNHTQLYLIIGHDGARGTLELDGHGHLRVNWPGASEAKVFEVGRSKARALTHALQGGYAQNPLKTLLHEVITVHPLGGCPMGDDASTGVVNEWGQVFDGAGGVYRGLYVADGAVVPTSVGVNPLWTITALAERMAEAAAREWRAS